MNGYLLSIVGTVLFSAICMAILPEGKTAGMIKSIVRLACILAIVSPILVFLSSGQLSTFSEENLQTFFLQDGIAGRDAYIQYYSEMRIQETQKAIEREIKETYGAAVVVNLIWHNEQETVKNKYDIEKIRIEKICVKVNEQLEEEVVESMWEYLKDTYCSEVVIE